MLMLDAKANNELLFGGFSELGHNSSGAEIREHQFARLGQRFMACLVRANVLGCKL